MSTERTGGISRRKVLIGLTLLGGAVAGGEGARRIIFGGEHALTRERESVEAEFGIRILTVRDLYAAKGIPYPDDEQDWGTDLYKRDVPSAWNLEQLKTLKAFLKELPGHYYAPSPAGERLGIVLSNKDCQCGSAYNETKPYRVEMSYTRFGQATRRDDFVIFTHELTHIQTPVTGYTYHYFYPCEKSIEEVKSEEIEILKIEESPWYDEINRILGSADWFETRTILGERRKSATDGLYDKLPRTPAGHLRTMEEWEEILQKIYTPEEREKYWFYARLSDALWYPDRFLPEFVAFLAENYVKGRPYFEKRFGEIFDQGEYQRVYAFTKKDIFRGKEYSKHPFA